MIHLTKAIALGLFVSLLVGGCAEPARKKSPPSPAPTVSKPVAAPLLGSARLEASIYVTQTNQRVSEAELRALADRPAPAGEFAKALEKLGPTRVLYRVDQVVNLDTESKISLGEPGK